MWEKYSLIITILVIVAQILATAVNIEHMGIILMLSVICHMLNGIISVMKK